MPLIQPDKTFYPSPMMAMQAPKEGYCYVVILQPPGTNKPDALVTVDLNETSSTYGQVIGRVDMPNIGDELHHYGWNACSSSLCPFAPHPHIERRYLVIPGLRSSNIYILDTKENPHQPTIIKTITADEILQKTNYSRIHTIHCGPAGIFVNALGDAKGDGPGGIFLLDHQNFNILGRWEVDRGPQYLSYDFWWHLGYDTLVTSEWGTPNMIEEGLIPEKLLNSEYGHQIHIWDLLKRKHIKALDLGKQYQMVLELRPAHNPTKAYGFACVVVSLEDLSSSIWLWYREKNDWHIKKVIDIPAEPEKPDNLPTLLKDFKAVPPLVTEISLSLDDNSLLVSCWGTGKLLQYDVSDPFKPRLISSIKLGGIAKAYTHPAKPDYKLIGGPQMLECSLDGKRAYFTNSLYSRWDDQFYPEGIKGWMVKVDIDNKGMKLDPNFFVDFGDERPHQIRLQGGDASTDSYCYS